MFLGKTSPSRASPEKVVICVKKCVCGDNSEMHTISPSKFKAFFFIALFELLRKFSLTFYKKLSLSVEKKC